LLGSLISFAVPSFINKKIGSLSKAPEAPGQMANKMRMENQALYKGERLRGQTRKPIPPAI
jgi:hypothetical protein